MEKWIINLVSYIKLFVFEWKNEFRRWFPIQNLFIFEWKNGLRPCFYTEILFIF